MASATTILDRATGILKIDRTSIGIAGLEETQLLAVLNGIQSEWLEAHKKGGGEPPEYVQGEFGGTALNGTALNADSTTASTSLTLDSNTNATSTGGAFVIYDDDMSDVGIYTGKSGTTILTGVSGLSFAHADGDDLYYLYALPTDFRDLREEDGYRWGFRLEGAQYQYVSGDPSGAEFTIYDNAGTKYLWLPRDVSGDFSLLYNKQTTIDDGADTVIIPDSEPENQWYLVWKLVSYGREVLGIEGIDLAESRATKILADEMRKRTQGKKVKLAYPPFNSGSRGNFYNSAAGYRGFYR